MAAINIAVPTLILGVPGTDICFKLDAATIELIAALGCMAFILLGAYLKVLTGAEFYTMGGVVIGWIATKIFGTGT